MPAIAPARTSFVSTDCNFNRGPTFDSEPHHVLDSDFCPAINSDFNEAGGHALNFGPVPTLVFDPSPVLNFDPFLKSALCSAFDSNSVTGTNSDLHKAQSPHSFEYLTSALRAPETFFFKEVSTSKGRKGLWDVMHIYEEALCNVNSNNLRIISTEMHERRRSKHQNNTQKESLAERPARRRRRAALRGLRFSYRAFFTLKILVISMRTSIW
ncbi:hypothetical protein EVAR_55068_1 [Eumeta japonica]|uniref:Uncharacterized protein n=1 Tax=Eumeta variegata TaxID=151549 RepID=A0A4C1Z0K4_EUMVA|nr:hypothetical protein EVAR_55068_1 [Eumeta japonica]